LHLKAGDVVKRFNYRLEPVLKHRAEKEERAVLAQSLAQQEFYRQERIMAAIRSNLDNLRNAGMDGAMVNDYLTRMLYMDYLTARLESQVKIVENMSRDLEKKRTAVIEARKDKMILEKLKEKLYEKYKAEINKWETKLTDDQSTILTYRNKTGEQEK